ncbi:MAG: S49 family peptidase [Candidatus Puniceispirillaceae bacterium]|nr:S49 family peptidase [Pseudomonadota bacterium]
MSVVRLSGIIAASASPARGRLSLQATEDSLKKAFSMSGIKAVVLIINSPGGSPVQSELIGSYIRQLALKHDVPVLAFCEDVAASGGYWIAAAADEIYASSVSVVGSIGVISAGFGFPELLEKLGVERRVYTSGKSKSMLDPFRAENPDDIAYLKQLQNQIHQRFIDHVKSRRGSRLAGDEDEIFSGKFWTGETAHQLGLIDGVGLMREVLEARFGEKLQIVTIAQKKGFMPFGLSARIGRLLSYDSAVDDAAAKAIELSLWQRYGL